MNTKLVNINKPRIVDISKNLVMKIAGEILITKGVDALHTKLIAEKLNIRAKYVEVYFQSADEILLALYESFNNDFNDFLKGLASKNENPDAELSLLFKQLYFIFLQKPCHLMLIQEKGIINRNQKTRNAFFEIRKNAINHLTNLIERGKHQNLFKTNRNTRNLAIHILAGFREMMADEEIVRDKLNELKSLRNNQE